MSTMRQDNSRCSALFNRGLLRLALAALVLVQIAAAGCSANKRPTAAKSLDRPIERGVASWYGPRFHGRLTANGERYDMHEMTAAHPTLPFGTRVQVRNVRNGQSALVRINDRGPFKKNRVIDVSFAAAKAIGLVSSGTALVDLYLAATGGGAAPSLSHYTVQVGAFSDVDRAASLKANLSRIYPETRVHGDGTWSRVQVGSFDDRQQAETLRRELAALGMPSVVVSAAQ
ncbi:MAG TPA: septal ring lytic transglycosylase RlpA family protein [Thermoanaerobaculia bacterium]|nr:septal ring lytic transglycosylase RlpA family protein [Thermoanaerobaculia bacterium]